MSHEDRLNQIIKTLVASENSAEILSAYKAWASTYDDDLDHFGYVAPVNGAALFHKALNRPEGLIFDAGCGTGLSGMALQAHGYTRMDGADFSAEMLAKAAEAGVYQTLQQLDFRQPLPIESDMYDGVTCIGVYSSFIGEGFLDELVRITQPSGVIVMTCRADHFEHDLLPQAQRLDLEGNATIESMDQQLYMAGQNAMAAYLVLRVR